MKNLLFTLSACALCASIAGAAPAKTAPKAKVAPVKTSVKVAAKTPAKIAVKPAVKAAPTTKIAQADATMKPEEMPGFFPDVPRDHWAFAAVQRLAAAGIVQGYPAAQTPTPVVAAKPDEAKEVKVAEKTETEVEAAPERVAAVPTETSPASPDNSAK